MKPLSILASGMVSGVGLNAAASCAAIRVGISGAKETGFMYDGAWLVGCQVPLDGVEQGPRKLMAMASRAVRECLGDYPHAVPERIVCIVCLAESGRPGISMVGTAWIDELECDLGCKFHSSSRVVTEGRVGAAKALAMAGDLLNERGVTHCLIVGVDSLFNGRTLDAYFEQERLLTRTNSDGFIPGEAAGAVLLGVASADRELRCLGVGIAKEPSHVMADDPPLRGEGLASAVKSALEQCGKSFAQIDCRITGDNGEQYGFKEGALAMARVVRPVKVEFDIWHPAECVGEVGAATLPVILTVALAACRKGYARGSGILCHVGNDDGLRAAVVLDFS